MVHNNLCGSQLNQCWIFIKKLVFAQELRKFLLFWNPKYLYQCSPKTYLKHSARLPSNLLPHTSLCYLINYISCFQLTLPDLINIVVTGSIPVAARSKA